MSNGIKIVVGLVKSDMTVLTDTEYLQINTACSVYHFLIFFTLRSRVIGHTVGNVGARNINIDVIEKMLVHKIAVALIVIGSNRIILVEVECGNVGEIYLTHLIHFNKLIVKTDWRRTGCKSKYTVGLKCHLACHKLCGTQGHLIIIITNYYSHFGSLNVFFYNFLHILKLCLYLFNKLELGTGAVKIMVLTVDFEISVAVKIVAKKSHSAFI